MSRRLLGKEVSTLIELGCLRTISRRSARGRWASKHFEVHPALCQVHLAGIEVSFRPLDSAVTSTAARNRHDGDTTAARLTNSGETRGGQVEGGIWEFLALG